MTSPISQVHTVVPDYTAIFEYDVRGWYHAWRNTQYSWRGWGEDSRPRLYHPTRLQYKAGEQYFAVDGLGRESFGNTPFECTINPDTGKFERLCVQTRDSFCTLGNGTWDRTVIRNSGPRLLRLATYPLGCIPLEKRHDTSSWAGKEWALVALRWTAASLGIFVLLLLPAHGQPLGKNPRAYLPFLYNGYRYPRLARNFWENREEVLAERPNDPAWASGNVENYRAFKPRYLCYLIEKPVGGRMRQWFETRAVLDDDHTPYVFISYTKSQFRGVSQEQTNANYQLLYSLAIKATLHYAKSIDDEARRPTAFWLDIECLRSCNVGSEAEQKRATDQDIYSMSDVIRGGEHTIVIARTEHTTPAGLNSPDANEENHALQGWGQRVWTLPEVILSKGDSVTMVINRARPQKIPKVRFAQRAWTDAGDARQLVEHFTNLRLSRLELVSIAMKSLKNRRLTPEHPGDRSYALMGLLRVRPGIDSYDSSFQAFARLSLPQDNDRLMERLICLLPDNPNEPWDRMTDKYRSTLWDIYPDTQVCGIGENDTIIVDGFKGAMIQWSMFSTVQTTKRITWKRKALLFATMFTPVLLSFGALLIIASPVAGAIILVLSVIILFAAPAYVPSLYTGKLTHVEPCLFGIEGYVPLPLIEEMLFGAKMNRMSWSPYGSPLSRHRHRIGYRERRLEPELEGGTNQMLVDVYTYPVEAIDPCSPCDACLGGQQTNACTHETLKSVDQKSRSDYGSMKVFTLIDTYSMTATLFEAHRPPVVLMVGGSEGGMKRALACSYDVTTGTLYRETVLRVPSQTMDCMHSLQRVRLGLKNPHTVSDVMKSEANNQCL